jgi:hypothetical protein
VRVASVMSAQATLDDSVMVDRLDSFFGIDHGLI